MRRVVEPELLDDLPAADPRAVRSRADLRRLNFLMGHARIFTRLFATRLPAGSGRLRVIELGSGDGSLLLRLARRWSKLGVTADVTLLDRQMLLTPATCRAFAALNWSVASVPAEVLGYLERSPAMADLMLANLFLHHFTDPQLHRLLQLAASRTKLFLACEPRRSRLALNASRLVGLAGCNAVTRHDAAVSVRAGFDGEELSALWPPNGGWVLNESPAGLFSHAFIAQHHG